MSEVRIKLTFEDHPCTNHSDHDYRGKDEDCEMCTSCRCEDGGYCCGTVRHSAYCPDCGCEVEREFCYACNGEECGNCQEEGVEIPSGEDCTYSGVASARWVNGTLVEYYAIGHPHIMQASYCLGEAAPLFEGVTTKEQAVEAVVTHISNVDFGDGLGGTYTGIGAA